MVKKCVDCKTWIELPTVDYDPMFPPIPLGIWVLMIQLPYGGFKWCTVKSGCLTTINLTDNLSPITLASLNKKQTSLVTNGVPSPAA